MHNDRPSGMHCFAIERWRATYKLYKLNARINQKSFGHHYALMKVEVRAILTRDPFQDNRRLSAEISCRAPAIRTCHIVLIAPYLILSPRYRSTIEVQPIIVDSNRSSILDAPRRGVPNRLRNESNSRWNCFLAARNGIEELMQADTLSITVAFL